MFTSEEYKPNSYYLEQLAGEISGARVDYLSDTYFVLSSDYFKHYLIGNIKADCVILMGCNGLVSEDMAQAWIDAGASSYVGWCGDISINMTDVYTKDLVQSYIKKGLKQGILDHLPSKELKEEDPAFVVYVGIQ